MRQHPHLRVSLGSACARVDIHIVVKLKHESERETELRNIAFFAYTIRVSVRVIDTTAFGCIDFRRDFHRELSRSEYVCIATYTIHVHKSTEKI